MSRRLAAILAADIVGYSALMRSCALCIVDTKGTVAFECELACEVSDISDCLSGFLHPIERVGFEAGTMSQHLFFGLQAEGFDVVCMEARQVNAALSAMRNKTDRNDARGIAQVLRTGWFSPVHMKSREAHGQGINPSHVPPATMRLNPP